MNKGAKENVSDQRGLSEISTEAKTAPVDIEHLVMDRRKEHFAVSSAF